MNSTKTRIQNIAFFKVRSTNSIPLRPGPVQCIRNCTNCIIRKTNTATKVDESENLISIKSFDNLLTRKSLWFFQYQSLQYHGGQIDLLKRTLKDSVPLTIYIVATTGTKDLKTLNMIFNHVRIQTPHFVGLKTSISDIESILKQNKTVVIPIQVRSCVSDRISKLQSKFEPCFGARHLRDLLEPCIQLALDSRDFDLNIVPVTITKDHDRLSLFGLGSVCVQISEPYKLSAYLNGLQVSQKSTHLVQHIYHDAVMSAAILPVHIVAFLLLHLERDDGVVLAELVDYMDWFRKKAIDIGMHLGFTGTSLRAVEIALIILDDFVQLTLGKYYRVRDIESLMDYADLVNPIIAYYGLIGKAILIEYNRDKTVENQLTTFKDGERVRVMRDKVIETGKLIAEKLEQRVPCRRPCTTIERCVEDTISKMANFGRYLKVEEPRIGVNRGRRWAGDSDDDDESYFRSNRDNPAFKSWILVTDRSDRRDRLNLFINAIELNLFPDVMRNIGRNTP